MDTEEKQANNVILHAVQARLEKDSCKCFRRLLARIVDADAWAGIMVRRSSNIVVAGDRLTEKGWTKFFCHLPDGETRTDLVALHHVLGESLQYASNDHHNQVSRLIEVAVTVGDIVTAKMGRNPGEQFVIALMKTTTEKEFEELIVTTLNDLGMVVDIEKVQGGVMLDIREEP